MNFKVSPSDLTFLYDECKRCFYLKTRHRISRPSIPIPAIFSKIAGLLKEHYDGKRTEELHINLPPGTVKYGEKYIKSQNFNFPGHNDTCFISGRFDIVIEFDNGTYGVIDFKTGNPEGEQSNLYSYQLHSYAYALEKPTLGSLGLSPISKLGLLYFYPSKVSQQSIDWLSYDANIHLVEIEKDFQWYLTFIEGILNLLESPEPPEASPNCKWCRYLKEVDKIMEI